MNEDTLEEEFVVNEKPGRSIILTVGAGLMFVFLCLLTLLLLLNQPPGNFPQNSNITIEPGSSVRTIVEQFEAAGFVRSDTILQATLAIRYDATAIKAGSYAFSEPISTLEVAKIIATVGPNEPLIAVTFPEGFTLKDYANIAEAELTEFDAELFFEKTRGLEGVLFPDTYFVPPNFSTTELVLLLQETFAERVTPLLQSAQDSDLTESEIIILASILEREANSAESMQMVAGILLNRYKIGMALQADATIEYVLDTPLGELPEGQLATALRKTDSPYNTYLYSGLPPTPIGNPGLVAIKAVLNPTPSEYFYYLTDESGTFHYARTLDEHNQNITRYLR